MARPRGVDIARIIQVIETKALRGAGTEEDKCREVRQYWDFDGNLLAEMDDECFKSTIKQEERGDYSRKAERLDSLYNELKNIHKEYFTDLRFCQLYYNFFSWLKRVKKRDYYYIEEDVMLEYIKEYAEKCGSKK